MTAHQAMVKAKHARTEEDYRDLADFYRQQEQVFSSAYRQQHVEFDYALRHWGGKSYPQLADRARLLEEYYGQRSVNSKHMADLFLKKASEHSSSFHTKAELR